jgi:hypothetical protein
MDEKENNTNLHSPLVCKKMMMTGIHVSFIHSIYEIDKRSRYLLFVLTRKIVKSASNFEFHRVSRVLK